MAGVTSGRGPLAGRWLRRRDPGRQQAHCGWLIRRFSRRCSATKLYDQIREKALCCSVAQASVEEIDELNILHATMLAMSVRSKACGSSRPRCCGRKPIADDRRAWPRQSSAGRNDQVDLRRFHPGQVTPRPALQATRRGIPALTLRGPQGLPARRSIFRHCACTAPAATPQFFGPFAALS